MDHVVNHQRCSSITGQTSYQPAPATGPGTFKPTEEQWKALGIEAVETRSFRTEQVTEGNIALDDDLNTPVLTALGPAQRGSSLVRETPVTAAKSCSI
jgi:hypothetical protein